MCGVATRATQVRKITDWCASVASQRIIPFPSIHPDYERIEEEIERIAGLGMRGLKFHPQYMHCAADDARTIRIAKAAAKAGLAMEFHAGYDLAFAKDELASPRQIRDLHEKVPDLRLLACHLGGWERWQEALEHLAGQEIYLETSFTLGQCPEDLQLRIIEKHPHQYLLFGTDAPWADQSEELAAFVRLKIPPELRDQALWANGHRFAGIQCPA
jgi:hypothetical protein